jgi:8-oxo-dGTP pyrophosphatase MutT (NUDIX family)
MIVSTVSAKLFWLLSRSGFAIYSHFPLFGPLKAALGIMRRDDAFLVIDRNDGRGVSFPGGLQYPWESPEQACRREVREETGLKVTKSVVKLRYYSTADVPVNFTVFEIEAHGRLCGSWEGTPCWLRTAELRKRLVTSQHRLLELLEN